MKKVNKSLLSEEVVLTKIYVIRGEKVVIDSDLAELYWVDSRVLAQLVRKNIIRFPNEFDFQMTKDEMLN